VLGTERHEARRIDNQLRGRSGRQGDPGETQFFVSLEDSLMRVFAPDSIKGLMGRFGIPEDEPITNALVSRALESAQTKIEGFNFDSRKHVLEFDNVLDKQRRAIYDRRRKILVGSLDEVEEVLKEFAGESEPALEVLKKKEAEFGREEFLEAARMVVLQTIDMLWVEHLESMEYLRGSVNLRAYGQRDPLTEYRKEGTRLYKDMEYMLAARVFEVLDALQKGVVQPAPESVITLTANDHEMKELGRNDKVTITNGQETREMKFKKAEPLLKQGWKLVE
jgi:preprotein translocase subunit SecA